MTVATHLGSYWGNQMSTFAKLFGRRCAVFVSVTLSALALSAPQAGATSATASLTAGSLAFVSAPPAVSFSATLNGTNQTPTTTQALDIGDATGSGSGWDVTATSTTFTCC